jgi:hypothetical protein
MPHRKLKPGEARHAPGKHGDVTVGDHVTAEWTWGRQRFQATGEVTKVSGKTVKVRLTEDAGGHFKPGFVVTTSTELVRKGGVSEARRYPKPEPPPRRFVAPRAEAPRKHRVADFNMLDDLIAHAGATHLDTDKDRIANKLYVPEGDGYRELRVWQKEGFWHAQNPERGKTVKRLPSSAAPIINRSPTPMWQRAKKAIGIHEAPSTAHRRTASGAEARGAEYAQDQLENGYFMDWVREQLAEAARMPPEDVLPLETKRDAIVIAKNMLQDLEWDAKRDLQEDDAFWRGFRKALDGSREWLADELLEIVVEYAIQTMIKRGKSPSAAAKDTVKKHHGTSNMFFGPGTTSIDAALLENAIWNRLVDVTISGMGRIKEGMEHFALDGTIQHFNQKPAIRAELKRRVVAKLGRDPFTNDDR